MIQTYPNYLDQYQVIGIGNTVNYHGAYIPLYIVIKAGSKVVGGLTSKFTGVRQNSVVGVVRQNSSAKQYEGEV